MPRGRPKGSKNKTPETEAPPASNGVGHNGAPGLTDDQTAALFFQHKKAYSAALAVKKDADAKFKNACKLAKSELGDDAVPSIKDALLLETEEGEAKIKAEIERKMRIARWMAVPFGSQPDFFEEDRTPAVDRARAEGKRDGLSGVSLKPPYDPSLPQYEAYAEGWHEGQAASFAIQRTEDAALFDDAPSGAIDPPAVGGETMPEAAAEPALH